VLSGDEGIAVTLMLIKRNRPGSDLGHLGSLRHLVQLNSRPVASTSNSSSPGSGPVAWPRDGCDRDTKLTTVRKGCLARFSAVERYIDRKVLRVPRTRRPPALKSSDVEIPLSGEEKSTILIRYCPPELVKRQPSLVVS
jgi:hypothetical protein